MSYVEKIKLCMYSTQWCISKPQNTREEEYKGRNFLDLNNDDNQPICPMYSKGGAWLKHFGLSNLMCVCVCITRLIMTHAPIGEYRLSFFHKETFSCTCGDYPIEMRRHIYFDCVQYNKLWNPTRESLKDVLMFLEFDLEVFCFQKRIISVVYVAFLPFLYFSFFSFLFVFN